MKSVTSAGRRFLEALEAAPSGRRRLSWMDSRPAQRLLDAGHIEMSYEVVRTRANGQVVEDFFVTITDAGPALIAGKQNEPAVAPATVEGSESSGAVVHAQADGDHAVAGTATGDLTPYELSAEQCAELATLLREAAGAIGPRPSLLTEDLERWADELLLVEVDE